MSQQYTNTQTLSKKVSFIIFVKGSIAPIVLYLDEPEQVYENVQNLLNNPEAPEVFEIEANGPIKKVSVLTKEVTGCALQDEVHLGK